MVIGGGGRDGVGGVISIYCQTSFLELSTGDGPGDGPAEPMTSDSMSALPADVEAGEFEIKCATSCEFVKKGMAQFASGTSGIGGGMGGGNGGDMGLGAQVGRGAMAAADALTDLEMKLQGVQEKLKVSPLDKKLISQEKKLKAQISAQTIVLQAAGWLECRYMRRRRCPGCCEGLWMS